MQAEFKRASPADIATLLLLMQEFYAHEELAFDEARARQSLLGLLQNEAHGHAYLIFRQGELAGYAVLTFGYSLEFGGVDALVDELYLREAARGQGLGRETLAFLAETCRARGIQALHLVVEHKNARAHAVYQQFGFRDQPRHLMTKWLI